MFSRKFIISQIVFVLIAALFVFRFIRPEAPAKLPVLGHIKDFTLIDSEGRQTGLAQLKGHTWVADFFFTTCSTICPMMSAHMGRLHQTFKDYPQVRLVSFTVNPENDSPEVLKGYAAKFKADTRQWMFLTGSREELTQVAVASFKLGDIKEPVFHSSYFTLVDKNGQIRGYYDSSDVKNIDRIIVDLKQLLKAG